MAPWISENEMEPSPSRSWLKKAASSFLKNWFCSRLVKGRSGSEIEAKKEELQDADTKKVETAAKLAADEEF